MINTFVAPTILWENIFLQINTNFQISNYEWENEFLYSSFLSFFLQRKNSNCSFIQKTSYFVYDNGMNYKSFQFTQFSIYLIDNLYIFLQSTKSNSVSLDSKEKYSLNMQQSTQTTPSDAMSNQFYRYIFMLCQSPRLSTHVFERS